MNPEQQSAYLCLSQHGPLTDPKYAQHPKQAEANLQAQVRTCWRHRKNFPAWVEEYVKRWAAVGKSPVSTDLDREPGAGVSAGHGAGAV